MAGQEPALAQNDPKAYYLWLQTQGLSPLQAAQQVQQRFGAPKDPKQQKEDAANQQLKQTLAQTGGMVGGAVISQEALAGFPTVAGWFGPSAAVEMPTALGGAGILGGTGATAGTAGAGAAGAAGTAGAGAGAGGAAGGMGAGTIAGIAALGAVGLNQLWEGGMKDILRGRGTREDYINTGLMVGTGGLGGLPNLALRLMGKRSIGKMMTTGKSDAQLLRDDFRGLLKETGVADDNYNVTLADGSQFNIGLDGKTKLQNIGENIDKKKTRNAWDVDFSNPLAEFAVKQIDPMIRNIYQGADGKLNLEQYTGMLVNAATSNAKSQDDVIANINAMLGKSTFAKQAGVALPEMPKGRQVAPVAKTPQVSTPEGKEKSKSIRDVLQQNMGKK
jgi:hypothetical protein